MLLVRKSQPAQQKLHVWQKIQTRDERHIKISLLVDFWGAFCPVRLDAEKWFCYSFICWFQLIFHFFFALTWTIVLKFNGAKQMAASKARKLNWQFFRIHWSPNACFLLWSLWLSSTWRYGSDFLGFFVVGHLWPPVEEHHTTSEAER